tara:strand:- start:481 stop:738 length:258 start_codon:yes stop_codon:yes gene_type:complete
MKRDMEDILLDLIDGDIDIDKAKEELLFLNSVSKCLPTDKEIFEEAQKVERFMPFDSDILQAESAGRFHGFNKGVKFIIDKLDVC